MPYMNPLQTNQRVLSWLCGQPPSESERKWKRLSYIAVTSFIMIGHLLSVVASTIFIHRNISDNLEETLFALMHVVSAASMIYQIVVTSFLRQKLASIFDGLLAIYKESKLNLRVDSMKIGKKWQKYQKMVFIRI